jgi:transcriptional regulator with XRE-family HTH domain
MQEVLDAIGPAASFDCVAPDRLLGATLVKRSPDMPERARAAREALGLTQGQVAERLGISIEVYGRIERGLNTPRIKTLVRLCDVLHVTPNDLLIGEFPSAPRNLGTVRPELRRLLAVLDGADAATIKRVTEVARWLRERSKRPTLRGRRA